MGCCGARPEPRDVDMGQKSKINPKTFKKKAKPDKTMSRTPDASMLEFTGIVEEDPQHPTKAKIRLGYNTKDEKDFIKDSNSILENYGKLIFLLKTEPNYLSQLLEGLDLKTADQIIQILISCIFHMQDAYVEEVYLLALIDAMITQKKISTSDTKTFLRENSPTTKLLQAYTKLPQIQSILGETLKLPMKKFLSQNLDLEIDPDKLKTTKEVTEVDEKKICELQEKNLKNLENACDSILQAIYEKELPIGLRIICRTLSDISTEGGTPELVRQRSLTLDPSEDINVTFIGAFIFLRFFSPALVDLRQIGITDKVSSTNGRNLRLIVKTIQNLANGVTFGDKEKFMTLVNPYLIKQFPALKRYFKKITDIESIKEQISRNPLSMAYAEISFEDLCCFFDVMKNTKQWESTSDPAKLVAEISKKAGTGGLTLAQMK